MNEMTTMSAGEQVPMMVAMMLPAALPAVVRLFRAHFGVGTALRFTASYVVVWSLAGLAIYELWRPRGVVVPALLTIAAVGYELTPFKRACRRRCQELVTSGFLFGLYCLGSMLGLMVVLVALDLMSAAWMAAVGVAIALSSMRTLAITDRRSQLT